MRGIKMQPIDTENLNKPIDTTFPRFYIKAVVDQIASKKTGEEVYRDEEWVKIANPGNFTEEVNRRVKGKDKTRFANYYKAWKEGREEIAQGFPLDHWVLITPSETAQLKAVRCRTVEQLANMPEQSLPKHLPTGIALQIKARKFLDQQKNGAEVARLQTENEDLRKSNDSLTQSVEELKAQVNAIDAKLRASSPVVQNIPDRPPGL